MEENESIYEILQFTGNRDSGKIIVHMANNMVYEISVPDGSRKLIGEEMYDVSMSPDGTENIDVYMTHCMFILPVREKMMFGSYHFPVERMEDDMRLFMEILKSIQIAAEDKDDKWTIRHTRGI